MVCLGILFGCKNYSAVSYILSALAIVGIILGLRIICYSLYRLLNRHDHHGEPRTEVVVDQMQPREHRRDHQGIHGEASYDRYGVEMQPREREQARHCRVSLAEGKVVILAGENHASCLFRHRWVLITAGFIVQIVTICFIRFDGSDELARSITWCRSDLGNITLPCICFHFSIPIFVCCEINFYRGGHQSSSYSCRARSISEQ